MKLFVVRFLQDKRNIYEGRHKAHSTTFSQNSIYSLGTVNQTYERWGTYTILASFPVPGDAWSSLPFNHYKEHVIRKVQENQQGLDFSGVHQVVVNKTDAGSMDKRNLW